MDKTLVKKTLGKKTSEERVCSEEETEEFSGTTGWTGIEVDQGIESLKNILEGMTKEAVGHNKAQRLLRPCIL